METIYQRAAKIKLLVCDIDGVFTDGQIYFGHDGEAYKTFNIKDGLGLKLLTSTGVEIAVITGRQSNIITRRMKELDIQYIFQGQEDKLPAFDTLIQSLKLDYGQVAYIGDDLPDLPLISRAGLGVTVADGDPFVKQHADWQTKARGGQGALRELCELIMSAQNNLDIIQNTFLK